MKRALVASIRFGLLIVLVAVVPYAAFAEPFVSPGETLEFAHADGGGTQCRIATGVLPDTGPCEDPLTTFHAADNFVRAVFDATLLTGGLGEAHYTTAWIYNNFSIPGDPNNLVDAQISVTFGYYGVLFAGGAFKTSGTLSLEVADVTPGDPIRLITGPTIFQQERSGDQGFSDIAIGQELQYPRGESASIQVKLRRGRTYRITFKLETLAEEFAVGRVVANASASWSQLSVTLGSDEVEQLSQHDGDIKSAIATHDATMKAALEQHDADIKRKLDELDGKLTDINAKLDEIIDLLLTPQGRREGFPLK
jgi:hypothetical protein